LFLSDRSYQHHVNILSETRQYLICGKNYPSKSLRRKYKKNCIRFNCFRKLEKVQASLSQAKVKLRELEAEKNHKYTLRRTRIVEYYRTSDSFLKSFYEFFDKQLLNIHTSYYSQTSMRVNHQRELVNRLIGSEKTLQTLISKTLPTNFRS